MAKFSGHKARAFESACPVPRVPNSKYLAPRLEAPTNSELLGRVSDYLGLCIDYNRPCNLTTRQRGEHRTRVDQT